MYPDWPLSSADLVPLPRCDGPKLEPFDFQGPQEIEFLEYAGEGLHAHVVKVQIHGKIYALKLFRFCYDENWQGPGTDVEDDRTIMSAFYDYSEPFSCECRAFGRLKEAGHEELAVGCFGYVLLDEEHEQKVRSRFPKIKFDGDINHPGNDFMRLRYLGRDGRPPPIRGIVKEFARPIEEEEIREADVTKILGDVKKLQQLGIIRIDVAARQLVGGRVCDFSTAITAPHFLMTPELNPRLTRQMRDRIELETFIVAKDDYLAFDEMMCDWDLEHAEQQGAIDVCAFPGRKGAPRLRHYELRNKAARERIFTYVDPRLYDWKKPISTGRKKPRRNLRAKPRMWVYHCGEDEYLANILRISQVNTPRLPWECRDGLIFPMVEAK